MRDLRRRVRLWTAFFIVGLVLSGLTALPLPTEARMAAALLGDDFRAGGLLPDTVATRLRAIHDGVLLSEERAPFMLYGTDWLAFGHIVIAIAFVGAWRDPVRNRWLYEFGMIACALVPVWAFVFGPLRGIPAWWRVIDAAFGVVGFVPLWLCHRWTGEIEARATPAG
jgi:hypothetical protein